MPKRKNKTEEVTSLEDFPTTRPRYDYLLIREDTAAARAMHAGFQQAVDLVRRQAADLFTCHQDEQARFLRGIADTVESLRVPYEPRTKARPGDNDRALKVLRADDMEVEI